VFQFSVKAKPQAAVLLWCLALFVYGIASGPLYRTESLRAIIGAESLRGNWLYPVLYGEPFLTKPPGHYAAIAVCSLPFGEVTDWSARIPSALAATLTVFLMWWLLREVLDERSAFLAALLVPCSVLWLDKAPSAEIDMTLTGGVTSSLFLFHRGRWTAAYLCLALATLTKWTAPGFFLLTILPLLAWRRELHVLFHWRHLLAASLAGTLLAVWALAVANETGWDALASTIRSEAAYRFNPPPKAKGYPYHELATYPLLVLAAHLPVAFFALRTLRIPLDERSRAVVQLLHCWVWPNLLFWALVPNHSVRYILPISPALMVLGAIGFFQGRGSLAVGSRLRVATGFLLMWLVVKIVHVEFVVPNRDRDARPVGAELRDLVPPGEPLHLYKLKDEGVLFYFGRPAKRLHEPEPIPPGGYALLLQLEWDQRRDNGDLRLVRGLYDQQHDPIYLVKRTP
jgi:4-amino-4-deoxy-L-arabinose transferase-like glycosyltransferase